MTDFQLVHTRLMAGTWEGVLSGFEGDTPPSLVLKHLNNVVAQPNVSLEGEQWIVRVAVPAECIGEGVQTFVIVDDASDDTLASFALIAGEVLSEDLRAEVDLLRAELDMLKQAFRRHCLETGAADG